MKTPDIDNLGSCMDGIGAEIPDARVIDNPINGSSRKYKVRYYIPTISSSEASSRCDDKTITVDADSAEDAVRAAKAAHPSAVIIAVERG